MGTISTSTMRTLWADFFKKGYTGTITLLGRSGVKYHEFTLPAWRALEAALAHHGYGPAAIVSTYYPRYISGTTRWSLHSYSGVALDIDPALNPYKKGVAFSWSHTIFTPAQVAAVKAIRTVSGAQVWRWGGDSFGSTAHDYMHWQLNCTPDDIRSGIDWSTVPDGVAAPVEEEYELERGAKGEAVRRIQQGLLGWDADALPRWGADADFGDETAEWVGAFQAELGLPVTQKVDGVTAALIDGFRPISPTAVVPDTGDLEQRVTEIEVGLDAVADKVGGVITTLRSVG